ncbi:Phosphatidylinositide phosphatase SAC2 [Trichinella pseudospiralis]|uniref:Phosphatidylinositide phosphatase SAC2 n=3 Tax=Trichinella pseudospiralis TaxID=6337 RepID=A0A0V1JNE1_TRIPS|nr:Phosphatidylinositide phosphatase SAC2 [Trichinella pseudospiralis]KRZ36454.1 Phosphatidylinositide phosphatase SAC2 [Trichinella pseudospiralis]
MIQYGNLSNEMELLASPSDYVFVRGESVLRISRISGKLFTGELKEQFYNSSEYKCLGIVFGIMGILRVDFIGIEHLLLIAERQLVGQHPLTRDDIFAVGRVEALPLKDEQEKALDCRLPPCSRHTPAMADRRWRNFAMISSNYYFAERGVSAVKKCVNRINKKGNSCLNTVRRRCKLLRDVKRLFNEYHAFFYCQKTDLTRSMIELVENVDRSTTSLENSRFCWNSSLVRMLTSGNGNDGSPSAGELFEQGWVWPIICGFAAVEQLDPVTTLALISRRSVLQAGPRNLKRGMDSQGNCANYVETEQIVAAFGHVSSFVLVRGSIPAFWSHTGKLHEPRPEILATKAETMPAFKRHVEQQLAVYGAPLVFVNLVDPTGREKALDDTFLNLVLKCNDDRLVFVAFDYNTRCGLTRMENLRMLLDGMRQQIQDMRFAWIDKNGQAACKQNGVFRVNCVDCLDRTNLVQTAIAKLKLEEQLRKFGVLLPEVELDQSMEKKFRTIWADNGDRLSCQYAGTDAMKGHCTRTGKLNFSAVLKDGYISISRHYLSYASGAKMQVATDCILGRLTDDSSNNNSYSSSCSSSFSSTGPNHPHANQLWPVFNKGAFEDMMKLCQEHQVDKNEIIVNKWLLRKELDPCLSEDQLDDMDCLVLLTEENYHVFRFGQYVSGYVTCSVVPLRDITAILIGDHPSAATLPIPHCKAKCVRIEYRRRNGGFKANKWFASNFKVVENRLVPFDPNESTGEYLNSVVSCFRSTFARHHLLVPVDAVDKLDSGYYFRSAFCRVADENCRAKSITKRLSVSMGDLCQQHFNQHSVCNNENGDGDDDDDDDDDEKEDSDSLLLFSNNNDQSFLQYAENALPSVEDPKSLMIDMYPVEENNLACNEQMTKLPRSSAPLIGTLNSMCQNAIKSVSKQFQERTQKTIGPKYADRYAAQRDLINKSRTKFILLGGGAAAITGDGGVQLLLLLRLINLTLPLIIFEKNCMFLWMMTMIVTDSMISSEKCFAIIPMATTVLRKIFKVQQRLFTKHLLLTNVTSGMVIGFFSDIVQQKIKIHRQGLSDGTNSTMVVDIRRASHLSLSTSILSVEMHFWYKFLDRLFPTKALKHVLVKVCCDELIMAPNFCFTMLASVNLLEGSSWIKFTNRLKNSFLWLYLADVAVYTPVQLINFYFLSTKYRTVFVYAASAVYLCLASYALHDLPSLSH